MVLTKLRLAVLVVVSAISGYLFADGPQVLSEIVWLSLGGLLVTAGSSGLNEVLERNQDAVMKRTQNRPIPAGRMSVATGVILSLIFGIAGLAILYFFLGYLTAALGLLSLVLYVAIYTPLKKITPLAVFVGAIPGALPPMLGYIAKSNEFGFEPGILFFVQFMWQFPHFWAIAWIAHEDYMKAGYHLLPSKEGKSRKSSTIILVYTLVLIPVSLSPWVFELAGWISFMIASLLGGLFYLQALKLHRTQQDKDAKKLMFYSFLYLPIMQFTYVLDKI